MATSDGIPVSIVCDRGFSNNGVIDLTPQVAEGTLAWSSVVPGGFASCAFQIEGDFRRLAKQIPYLATIRIIGDSGAVLWEGQVEDVSPTLSATSVGVKVTAMGWQNVLKETTVRAIWSNRSGPYIERNVGVLGPSSRVGGYLDLQSGNYDPTDLSKSGCQVAGNGGTVIGGTQAGTAYLEFRVIGLTLVRLLADVVLSGTNTGAGKLAGEYSSSPDGTSYTPAQVNASGSVNVALAANSILCRFGGSWTSGSSGVVNATDLIQWSNIRILGTSVTEDVAGGFYGDTLIKNLIQSYVTELGLGVIESGSDFSIDHLDASVRRTAYDILVEIASYYSREWAIWEGALLDWRTPNLSQPQWIIPIASLSALDLDASVTNSQKTSVVLYTDAASGITAEQSSVSSDRRNPYVLNGRTKDEIVQMGTMTSNTAHQLATILLNDLGFGPVPAAGTIKLPGDTIVQHAQGNAVKAWEIRAGQNVTIPELPMSDIFTQDGRGEVLFHIVSTDADTSTGEVTLTLDSYGSKRSDVLMARIAAVTKLLGG